MLTFLFALAAIWTLFWFIMLMLDWGEHDPIAAARATCLNCSGALTGAPAAAKAAVADTKPETKAVARDAGAKQLVDDEHDQDKVTPLFDAPNEKDDLKVIKGIGVVMEKTLNDLGITTFKQLAGFKRADVKMVSDVLSAANSGFGDRIDRDEWVGQAKGLVRKAS